MHKYCPYLPWYLVHDHLPNFFIHTRWIPCVSNLTCWYYRCSSRLMRHPITVLCIESHWKITALLPSSGSIPYFFVISNSIPSYIQLFHRKYINTKVLDKSFHRCLFNIPNFHSYTIDVLCNNTEKSVSFSSHLSPTNSSWRFGSCLPLLLLQTRGRRPPTTVPLQLIIYPPANAPPGGYFSFWFDWVSCNLAKNLSIESSNRFCKSTAIIYILCSMTDILVPNVVELWTLVFDDKSIIGRREDTLRALRCAGDNGFPSVETESLSSPVTTKFSRVVANSAAVSVTLMFATFPAF